jgi:hypothetical protein
MSTFAWIDYSEKQRRQLLEAIDMFREKDTRDELGIAGIRVYMLLLTISTPHIWPCLTLRKSRKARCCKPQACSMKIRNIKRPFKI